jgi:hypothetical protein
MIAYLLSLLGLWLNFLGTVLLLKYWPGMKNGNGATLTQSFETEFVLELRSFIGAARHSILFLFAGFSCQLLGTLLQKISYVP